MHKYCVLPFDCLLFSLFNSYNYNTRAACSSCVSKYRAASAATSSANTKDVNLANAWRDGKGSGRCKRMKAFGCFRGCCIGRCVYPFGIVLYCVRKRPEVIGSVFCRHRAGCTGRTACRSIISGTFIDSCSIRAAGRIASGLINNNNARKGPLCWILLGKCNLLYSVRGRAKRQDRLYSHCSGYLASFYPGSLSA